MSKQRETRSSRESSPNPAPPSASLEIIRRRFDEHAAALEAARKSLPDKIVEAAELITASLRAGGELFVFGNGGSAADATHIAGELVGRFLVNRRALRAHALTVDTSILTSVANDYNYDTIFARQLEVAKAGDVAWALSTSGNSPNVVAALRYAKDHGLRTIALTGIGGGKCAELADVLLAVQVSGSPRAQEIGALVYHLICELVEAAAVATKG